MTKYPWEWPDEQTELLKRLWTEGRTASQIAAEMGGGLSRGAVIGKVHRLHLERRAKSLPRISPIGTAAPAVRKNAGANNTANMRAKARASQPRYVEPPPDAPASQTLQLLDLTDRTCKWPIGHPGAPGFGFCGTYKPAAGSAYCPFHHRLAYTPPPVRDRPHGFVLYGKAA